MRRGDRSARLRLIRELVDRTVIKSQEEFLLLLSDRGYRVTQATLSRDLKALSIGKIPDGRGEYRYAGQNGGSDDLIAGGEQVILRGFLWMAFSGDSGLIKTLPGFANSIASGLDGLGLPQILGTIAGDDTILVVPRDGVGKADVVQALIRRMPELRGKIS
jgi:transcriptional regulator of arginine metabolism